MLCSLGITAEQILTGMLWVNSVGHGSEILLWTQTTTGAHELNFTSTATHGPKRTKLGRGGRSSLFSIEADRTSIQSYAQKSQHTGLVDSGYKGDKSGFEPLKGPLQAFSFCHV